ncbi:MAG: hypothetical protein WAL50_16125 [Kineosporiaceae bacterium]
MSASRPLSLRGALAAVAVAALGVVSAVTAPAADAATARSFTCSGTAGDRYTARTVTGLLTDANVPYQVVVTQTATTTVLSSRARRAALAGPSSLHAGFTEWDVTGANANGEILHLSVPPVLPGNGGFFDADLEESQVSGLQLPMFDCTVTGGPARLSTPSGTRTFSCTGSLGETFTRRTVVGNLNRLNVPSAVTVTDSAGVVGSSRARAATLIGPSQLHSGYSEWDVTGRNANGDLYHLNIPPVLPAAGGFFDADLDIQFAGGANGAWQIPIFDCTVA